jgi:hypothetical protein
MAIVEDYLYNVHWVVMTVDPTNHYVYHYGAKVYENKNIDTTVVQTKKYLIMKIINEFL